MIRTLILYINHPEDENGDGGGYPEEMTEEKKGTIVAHVQNWLEAHGLSHWDVWGEFEDEG